ncbi:germinal-center associated nuclear protein-like [Penaeus indicus]|uniref:germinal-center associated nuclear protein-like n=1 Tax=Penaeus indicus TaxID=29960 RepID=UPI00300C3B07
MLSAKTTSRETATIATSPNAFPSPFLGTGEVKPPSLFSTVKTESLINNDFSKDSKPAPTALLSRGITSTSQSHPSAARNVFGAPTASKLFEVKKNTSLPNETERASQGNESVAFRPSVTPQTTATANIFGGSALSKTSESATTSSSSSIFGGGTTDAPQTVKLFSNSVASVRTSNRASSKSNDQSASTTMSVSTSNIFGGSLKSKAFTSTSATQPVFSSQSEKRDESGGSSAALDFGKQTSSLEKRSHIGKATELGKIFELSEDKMAPKADFEIPESPTMSKKSELSTSPQYDKKELTKIIIAQIPDSCMDREILKNHFIKFGYIKRVTVNNKTNQATVQYEDHRSASRAKKKGKKIHPNLPEVRIFYGTPARRKSEDGNADAIMSKKKAIRTLQSAHTSSDIDPYEPLPRPSGKEPVELPKPIQARVSQPKPTLARVSQPKQREKAPVKPKKVPQKQGAGAKEKKEPSVAVEGKEPEEVIQSKCNTSYDKYLVLKTRDHLVRKETIRTSDIEKATYLSATCPDMCPEKERYMRDVQNDLSSYEMANGVMDHRLVVKKFSRSSADKDEPLPYELRPGPVLLKTMDFLVCNIIERGEDENVETDVWYNYLWNRTRAIRNDLMQQQLTDGRAVAIIERCMRFHIHAAARFCQEPPDLFDAKMNTEHLTKSLQTLKELYKDLGERGEYFETEPEFRAYELLLNLNEGQTFITQYSQYREEVQKSKEVQFALKVGMALMFNNYVKFFKLLKSATYLQACMMHRYFRQVRAKALDTLMKAYVPPKQVQTLPLETVIPTLGFENEADAESYLQVYGIKVTDKNVILDKSLFSLHVEEQPPVVRPFKMVESNRTVSVGQVIQGGPLPENPLLTHVPHDSFDSQGYLKKEALNASDQQVGKKVATVEIREHPVQQTQQWTSSELMACISDIYINTSSNVIKEMLLEISKEAKEEYQHESVNKVAQIAGKEVLAECLKEEISLVSERALQEVQYEEEERQRILQEEEERKRKAMQELLDKMSKVLCAEYVEEFVKEFVRNLSTKAVQEIEKETWEAVIAELIFELPQTLCREVTLTEVKKLCAEVITAMKDELEAKITQLQQKISMRKMRDSFKRWRLQVLRVKRRKQAQETFPASCSQLSITQQNELFGWGYHRSREENISAFQVSHIETTVAKNIEQMTIRNRLVRACAWHHLPLQQEMKKVVDGTLQPINLIKQYFKVLICTLENTNPTIVQWLRSKLRVGEDSSIQECVNSSFSFISKNSGLEYACLFREISLDSLCSADIRGTSAVIFLLPSQARKQNVNSQALNILKSMSDVPKLTIHFDEESCADNTEGILDSPVWKLAECDLYYPETSQKLLSHLLDLWNQQDGRLQLVSVHLNNFVYGFIAKKVVEVFLYKNHERIEDGKSPLPPQAYIDLYNEAMNHLLHVVEDEELLKLDWPAPGLSHLKQVPPASWNNSDADRSIAILRNLKLPKLELEDYMTVGAIKDSLHRYATKVCTQENSSIVLMSHLNVLLSNSLSILMPPNGETEEDPLDWKIHMLQLPWTELVYACISHKLTGLPDLTVYHQSDKLNTFKYPPSWWAACDASDTCWATSKKENLPPSSRKRKHGQMPEERAGQKKKPSQLLVDIEKEKNRYMEFEKKLEDMLEIEEELRNLIGT